MVAADRRAEGNGSLAGRDRDCSTPLNKEPQPAPEQMLQQSANGSRVTVASISRPREETAKREGKNQSVSSAIPSSANVGHRGHPSRLYLGLASRGLDWAPPRRLQKSDRRKWPRCSRVFRCYGRGGKQNFSNLFLTEPVFSWKPRPLGSRSWLSKH